ncbi:MAG: NAD(P)-dependent oxidoreductase [Candidatus Bathyarchaeia archaeon]
MCSNITIFINTSRGQVVDEAALIEVLENRKILGAGIDVFEEEPLDPASPLRRMENVVITPHTSSSTREAFRNTWKSAVDNIRRFVAGERPNWVVNREVLYLGSSTLLDKS